jgi:hypothetical protein
MGLLLPDLLRNYSKNEYNKKLINNKNGIESELSKGVVSHIKRDASFHESIFFKSVYNENLEICKRIFGLNEIPRYWFGIHILIEMQLDQMLIKEEEHLLHKMYQDIEKAIPSIELFLFSIEHQNHNKFLNGVLRFVESKYLLKYNDLNGISFGLNRVYQQVNADNRTWGLEIGESLMPLLDSINCSIHKHFATLS